MYKKTIYLILKHFIILIKILALTMTLIIVVLKTIVYCKELKYSCTKDYLQEIIFKFIDNLVAETDYRQRSTSSKKCPQCLTKFLYNVICNHDFIRDFK